MPDPLSAPKVTLNNVLPLLVLLVTGFWSVTWGSREARLHRAVCRGAGRGRDTAIEEKGSGRKVAGDTWPLRPLPHFSPPPFPPENPLNHTGAHSRSPTHHSKAGALCVGEGHMLRMCLLSRSL